MDASELLDATGTSGRPPRSLGMWAVRAGMLSAEQLQEAYLDWRQTGEAPGEVFVRRGWMTEQSVADALGQLFELPVHQSVTRSEDPEVVTALSAEEALRLEICPLDRDEEGNLIVALADPTDARLRELHAELGADARPVIVPQSVLTALLDGMNEPIDAAGDQPPSRTEQGDGGQEVAAERPAPDKLEQLHERLVSEHVQSSEQLAADRRRLTELAEEQARLERSIVDAERTLQEQELMLELVNERLTEPASPLPEA